MIPSPSLNTQTSVVFSKTIETPQPSGKKLRVIKRVKATPIFLNEQ